MLVEDLDRLGCVISYGCLESVEITRISRTTRFRRDKLHVTRRLCMISDYRIDDRLDKKLDFRNSTRDRQLDVIADYDREWIE